METLLVCAPSSGQTPSEAAAEAMAVEEQGLFRWCRRSPRAAQRHARTHPHPHPHRHPTAVALALTLTLTLTQAASMDARRFARTRLCAHVDVCVAARELEGQREHQGHQVRKARKMHLGCIALLSVIRSAGMPLSLPYRVPCSHQDSHQVQDQVALRSEYY